MAYKYTLAPIRAKDGVRWRLVSRNGNIVADSAGDPLPTEKAFKKRAQSIIDAAVAGKIRIGTLPVEKPKKR